LRQRSLGFGNRAYMYNPECFVLFWLEKVLTLTLDIPQAQNTCSLDNSSSLPTESSVSSGIEEDLANAQLDHYNMQLLAEVTNHGLKSLQDLFRKKHRRDEGGLEETIFSHDSDDLQSRELRMRQAELVCRCFSCSFIFFIVGFDPSRPSAQRKWSTIPLVDIPIQICNDLN
jgi:hypothetical protein